MAQSGTAGPDRLALLLDAVSDYAIFMLDPDGRVVSWNTGAQHLKGYKPDDIIGRHFSVFYTPEDQAAGVPARTLQAAAAGRYETEGWRVRQNGTPFWALVVIDPIRDPTGRLIGYAKVTRDMTERRAAQAALAASEQRFRLLVQGVTDYAIFMLDTSGVVTNWNAGAERIKGYKASEIVGQHFSRFYTEEDLAVGKPARALATALREGKFEGEGWRLRKDGTRFWASVVIDPIYDDAGALTGFAKITRDITERRDAQEALERTRVALQQSQKMEAIGQLTGGIAHDFNNLLTVIVNNLDLLSRNLPVHDLPLLDSTQRAAERGAKLTQQLLAFARRQPLRPAQYNLDDIIQGFEAVLRRACGDAVELDLGLVGGRPVVEIDAAQFESALLNLTVNACDAMPEGGRLTISSRWLDLDGSAAGALGLTPGPHIVVTVADTGTGMGPAVAERAFEPFFTTKEIGRGTGLGLSQVYGFVSQSGGHVTLASTEGKGTRISIYLPTAAGAAAPVEGGGVPVQRAVETALIVEDDFLVLESAAQLFRSLGYEVLTASDGPSALEILDKLPHVDVLFTDVAMPKGMNGVELARRVAKLSPGTRILLASGYPPAELTAQHGLFDEFSFISKPYRWTEVAEKLRGLRAA